jgi:hypothetical protein
MTEPRFKDDRTDEQRKTHTVLHGGVDTFLSSWGPPADAGVDSRAYWACKPEDCDKVRTWVRAREEFNSPHDRKQGINAGIDEIYLRPNDPIELQGYFPSQDATGDFVHIYAVNPGHPALT